jgi:co-chaperonin GroES (HSP10)
MAFYPVNGFIQVELISPTPKKGETIDPSIKEEFGDVVAVGDAATHIKKGQRVYFKIYDVFKFVDGKNEYNVVHIESIKAVK